MDKSDKMIHELTDQIWALMSNYAADNKLQSMSHEGPEILLNALFHSMNGLIYCVLVGTRKDRIDDTLARFKTIFNKTLMRAENRYRKEKEMN